MAKRSELLSFTSCPSLTFSVKLQHASSEPTHYSLCLMFFNVVDFFFLFIEHFLGGGGNIPKHFISKLQKFEVQREDQIFFNEIL